MNVRQNVRQVGDPILTQVADPVVNSGDPSLLSLIEDMLEVLETSHGVGIAAPQVGSPVQVMIVASRPNLRYPNAPKMDPLVMVNPTLVAASAEQVWGWEGCLSVPDQRGLVLRAQQVEVEFLTQNGIPERVVWQDFPARIFQHELDHLLGRVFLERDPQQLLSEEEYQSQILGQPIPLR